MGEKVCILLPADEIQIVVMVVTGPRVQAILISKGFGVRDRDRIRELRVVTDPYLPDEGWATEHCIHNANCGEQGPDSGGRTAHCSCAPIVRHPATIIVAVFVFIAGRAVPRGKGTRQ
ncbi:hypothetical protein DYI20_06130 [Auritidibacter ignavus]|nr:hypothetical protein DYI20_06130 [Auritidibacter ignavus]